MGEGFELVIWGGFLAMLWLRGLAKKAKKARALEGGDNGDVVVPGGASAAGPEVKGRPSLREQWAEMARQIEQQVQSQREAGQGTLVTVDEDDDERTVVIPGRRVIPAPRPQLEPSRRGRAELEADRRGTELARRSTAGLGPIRAEETPFVRKRRARPRQDASGLLGRLDRYSPIQQAVILSELLGPPLAAKGDQPIRD